MLLKLRTLRFVWMYNKNEFLKDLYERSKALGRIDAAYQLIGMYKEKLIMFLSIKLIT